RRDSCAPASRRGWCDRRRARNAPCRPPSRALDVRRPRCRDRPGLHIAERREHALPFLPEQLRAHLHRRAHARRPHEPLHCRMQIGIPRVLNIYSTAPIWRTYFETLGLKSEHIVFSDYTSEELWTEGGKYGSIDPCYPSKVCQAHIHNLLFHKPRNQFDYIFFPCITHVPSFVV